MDQLILNVLISISARLAEIATYLRLQTSSAFPVDPSGKVPDAIKTANLTRARRFTELAASVRPV
jgi:hypothetical protein